MNFNLSRAEIKSALKSQETRLEESLTPEQKHMLGVSRHNLSVIEKAVKAYKVETKRSPQQAFEYGRLSSLVGLLKSLSYTKAETKAKVCQKIGISLADMEEFAATCGNLPYYNASNRTIEQEIKPDIERLTTVLLVITQDMGFLAEDYYFAALTYRHWQLEARKAMKRALAKKAEAEESENQVVIDLTSLLNQPTNPSIAQQP